MSNNGQRQDTLSNVLLGRRSFLRWSAALGGTMALGGCIPYGFRSAKVSESPPTQTAGRWIPANCWVDCGSKGFNRVYVEDGIIKRQGGDETHPDSPGWPQLRPCARGRAKRQEVFGADRLKYPLKRMHWKPGGGRRELRGRDEWVRISWNEALDLVAGEIRRIKESYGNEAILLPAYLASGFGHWDVGRTLSLYGGFAQPWGSCSPGAWALTGPVIGLDQGFNDRMDMRNCELVVLWGFNPAWSRAGLPSYRYMQIKRAGGRFISVDPFFHPTAHVLNAEWIPCRPATDMTLALGMMYTLVQEDNPVNNPLIDWDFLYRCTVGFDADHMPPGADPKENFKDYLTGASDGIPKTPEWSAQICGVPPRRIRDFAREIATTKNVAICMSPAPGRNTRADSWPQAIMALGAMTGHLGKSGNMVGCDGGHYFMMGGPPLARGGTILGDPTPWTPGGIQYIVNPVGGPLGPFHLPGGAAYPPQKSFTRINNNEVWDAILTGRYTHGYRDVRDINIQMIYHTRGNFLNQAPGVMKGIEAHRKVEFVVTQNFVPTSTVKYSDIVLPVTTQWERYGDITQGYREMMLCFSQVVEPMFESKDDMWIAHELGTRLGLDPEVIEPASPQQRFFNMVRAATVIKEDGKTWEPLVTITEKDIASLGVEGKPQEGRIPFAELKEKGIFQIPREPGDNFQYIAYEAFRLDPEKHPLRTASGKLEIHCQTLADVVTSCGWSEIKPIPTYEPPIEGYEDTFKDWKRKEKGPYPLQFYDLHVLRQIHSSFANVPALREAFTLDLIMNPIDAKERGLKESDTVIIQSRHGKVLRPVHITNEMMPGVCALGQGAWVEIDEETGIDLAGCVNVLHGAIPSGQGHMGWNSCTVQVSKWTGAPLAPDVTWPQRMLLQERIE